MKKADLIVLAVICLQVFTSGCGGGNSAEPVSIDTTVLDAGGAAPSLTFCDGVMMRGSMRWCNQDDGTVRDMTTGTVWLHTPDCAEKRDFQTANEWAASLAAGLSAASCGLSEASRAGDWAIPGVTELLALTQGEEPVSSRSPRAFTIQGIYDYYWTNATWSDRQLYVKVVSFKDSQPMYSKEARDWGAGSPEATLAYRKYGETWASTIEDYNKDYKTYALAASTAWIAVPGTSDKFTRRFVNQIQFTFGVQDAAKVVLWNWDEDEVYRTYRIWKFIEESSSPGFYRIRSQPRLWFNPLFWDRWRYLAVENASTSAGAYIIAWPDAGGDNHLWAPRLNDDKTWYFVNKKSGMCMQWQSNKNDEQLQQHPCVPGHPNQSFIAFPRR